MDPGMLGWTLKLSVQLKTEPIYSVLEKVKSCFVTGLISLSRSSTGKQVLLIHSVSRCLLARQSGPMNVFHLHCHMSIEGSWSSQCLTGTSMSSWGMFYDCFMMSARMHNENQWGKLSKLGKHESWATHSIIFLYAEQALIWIWRETFFLLV